MNTKSHAEWASYVPDRNGNWRTGRFSSSFRVLKCQQCIDPGHQPHYYTASHLPVRCPGHGWQP